MTQLALLLQPRAKGEEVAQACAAKAERVSNFDADQAKKFVLRQLRAGAMPGEDIVDFGHSYGLIPHDGRAWGAVFGSLVRRNLIKCVGFTTRRKGHGTAGGRVWAIS